MGDQKSSVAVVMVPLPAQGHLNQLLHLSNRLASAAPSLSVYYVGAATHIRQAKLRIHRGATDNINFHEFPTPYFQTPEPDPHAPTKFPSHLHSAMYATLTLRDAYSAFVDDLSTKFKRVVVIFDSMMAYVVQDIHSLSNVESYCFWSVSAFASYYFIWKASGRPDNLPGEVRSVLNEFPGLDGIFSPEFADFAALQRGARKNITGNIHNSSRMIEGPYLDLVAEARKSEKQFVIGPFNPVQFNNYPEMKNDSSRHKCLDWLDKQDPNSVIFVSFGTTSSIPDEQIKELASGLESSEHKFLWVLREADKGDIFTGEVTRNPALPQGFEERVKGRGIIIRDWAPQLEILGHFATGGFMSHCGWNSCMESISMGVPIATWPMHSDQPMNAVLVNKRLRIGVEVKDWGRRDEVVCSSAVESAVRKLMGSSEGGEIRRRAKELGVAVQKSVMKDGISSNEMDLFIANITRSNS